jgi:hypothetical protein
MLATGTNTLFLLSMGSFVLFLNSLALLGQNAVMGALGILLFGFFSWLYGYRLFKKWMR